MHPVRPYALIPAVLACFAAGPLSSQPATAPPTAVQPPPVAAQAREAPPAPAPEGKQPAPEKPAHPNETTGEKPTTPAPQSTAAAAPSPPETAATIRDEIVVSANRVETPRRAVGSSVTVIDRDEIEARHEPPVLELLRSVPGVEVSQGGGPGKVASLFIRGGNSAHTLVLIDGVRVNSTTTGAFDFADLMSEDIERIEVLRGPESTLYGSEALAGVVSITTRRGGEGRRLAAAAEAGNLDTRREWARVEGGDGAFDYRLSLAHLATQGVSAASESRGNRERDPYDNLTASGRLGARFGGDGRADLALRYADGDTELDGFTFGVGPTDALGRSQQRRSLTGDVTLTKPLTPRWHQTLRLGVADEDLTGRDPVDPFSNFRIRGRSSEVGAQADVSLSESDLLTFGAGVEERSGENRGGFDEAITLRSLFVQNAWSAGERLHVTAGVRNDHHSEFGGETTYRVAVSALPAGHGTRLHTSFGTGFRAPSLNELFFPDLGNTSLRPETSRGFDLGVEQPFAGGRGLADLTYFDNRFEQLIVFDLATFTFGNVAAATASGVEAEVSFALGGGLSLTASHTYTDSEDLATGLPLPRRPRRRTTAGVELARAGGLSGRLTLVAVADRIDSDGSPMDDYRLLDADLAYHWRRGRSAYLRLGNLLDEDYEEINGYTSPGLTAAAGLTFSWAADGAGR